MSPQEKILAALNEHNKLLRALVALAQKGNNNPSKYVSVAEAANILRCSKNNVRALIASGKIEAFKPAGEAKQSRYLVVKASLEEFCERKRPYKNKA